MALTHNRPIAVTGFVPPYSTVVTCIGAPCVRGVLTEVSVTFILKTPNVAAIWGLGKFVSALLSGGRRCERPSLKTTTISI